MSDEKLKDYGLTEAPLGPHYGIPIRSRSQQISRQRVTNKKKQENEK